MENSQQIKPVLVLSPIDGKYYNLAPLFSFMQQFDESFDGISKHLEDAADMLPYLFKTEDWSTQEVEEALFEVRKLKVIFRKMKPIDN